MRILTRPLILAGSLLLAACSGISTVCTLVGCNEGLALQLDRPVQSGSYTVELLVPGASPQLRECPTDTACGGSFFFEGVSAETVTVRFVSSTVTHEQTVRPTYERTYPNGRGCDDGCLYGTATVRVPG